jgi:membrane protease YdiL (CAAX protease family)
VLIGVLLFAWVGPAEEILARLHSAPLRAALRRSRAGPDAAIYTLVHIWSLNLMLLAAAGLCGVFWGAMFWRFRSIWPALISHAAWDVVIFVLLPIR